MKNIVKICIRLFLILTVFQFINRFIISISTFIASFSHIRMFSTEDVNNVNIIDFLPFIIIWLIYLAIVVIIWVKSEAISKKIVGDEISQNIQISINYDNILSVGIVILGLFLIINPLPRIFSHTANYITSRSRFVVDDFFWRDFGIKQMIEIIGLTTGLLHLLSKENIKHIVRVH